MAAVENKEAWRRAKSLFELNRFQEAKNVLEDGLAANPGDSKTLNFLAYLYYRLGEMDKSRDAYRRLAGLEPENLAVWSNLGMVLLKQGLLEEARQSFEEYLSRQPGDAKILSYMAMVKAKLDRAASAREHAPPAEEVRTVPTPEVPRVAEIEAVEASDQAEEAVRLREWQRVFEEDLIPAARPYHGLSTRLVTMRLEGRVVFSLPSLAGYTGIVVLDQGVNPYGRIPRSYRSDGLVLMAAEGNGRLWLTHAAGWLVILALEDESLVLNAHHLVAFESTLESQWLPVGKDGFLPGLAALKLTGRGRCILAAGEGMAAVGVKAGAPVYMRPSSLVAWTPDLEAASDAGDDLKKVKDFFDTPFVRLEGSGRAFITGGHRV